MPTQVIRYTYKTTGSRARYLEIDPEDLSLCLNWCIRCQTVMSQLSNTPDADLREFRDIYWRRRRKGLPRGRDGQNTPESFIAGLVWNFCYAADAQRDLTEPQAQALEDISRYCQVIDPELSEITFVIRCY